MYQMHDTSILSFSVFSHIIHWRPLVYLRRFFHSRLNSNLLVLNSLLLLPTFPFGLSESPTSVSYLWQDFILLCVDYPRHQRFEIKLVHVVKFLNWYDTYVMDT